MKIDPKKLIVLTTVFIDIAGLGIIIPVIPFFIKGFGADDSMVTLIFAVYAFFSFFSTPFLGALSDRIGRRPVLIASLASTSIGWLIFASAGGLWMLFLGRIIDGLAAGNISTAQSYLVDLSADHKERTANLGLIGMIFGLGFIIGPLIGGLLGAVAHTLPFYTVGVLAAINTLLALKFLPETLKEKSVKKMSLNPLSPIIRGFTRQDLRPGLVAFGIFGTALAIQQSVFALYLDNSYGLNEFHSGLIFSGMGIVLAINQGFLVRRFWINKFKEPDLEQYLFLGLAAGFLVLGIISPPMLIAGLLLVTFSQSVLRVVMVSQMVGTDLKSQGEILGTGNSVMSLSMIAGPLIAGPLFMVTPSLPYWTAAALSLAAFSVISAKRKSLAKIKASPETEIIMPQ
jgi:predicted MFS family arabinose efflux permease